MRNSTLVICTLIALIAALPAQARGYFGVRGGTSEVKESDVINKRSEAAMGAAYIGAYSGPFRGEVEYTFIPTSKYKKEHVEADFQRIMGQAYIDLPVTPYVMPYLNAGAGSALYSIKSVGEKESGSSFAWNVGAGVGVKLTRNIIADAGFRYVDMGTVTVNKTDMSFDSYEGYVGARFLF